MDVWPENEESVPAFAVIHNRIDEVTIFGYYLGPNLFHLRRGDFFLCRIVTVVMHHVFFVVVFSVFFIFLKDENTVDHQLVYKGNEEKGLT